MVEIKMTGICRECKYADLELYLLFPEKQKYTQRNDWRIKCKHESACLRIMAHAGEWEDRGD